MTMELETSFVVLRPGDDQTPGEWDYAVVVDDAGHVTALGTAEEIADGLALAPGVEIPAGMPLTEVVAGEAVTLFDLNPHGAVVVAGGDVVGVLPTSVIDLAIAGSDVGIRTMGVEAATDSTLPGTIRVPTAWVRCAWPQCGFVNAVNFYDPGRPDQCGNPDLPGHAITLPQR